MSQPAEFPPALQEIVDFFADLPEADRREALVTYAESAKNHEPKLGEEFEISDDRHDDHCLDRVGIFLDFDSETQVRIRVSLGPKVQTLTRALTTILCKGLQGLSAAEIQKIDPSFVPKIVGAELMRLRSQTVYYVLERIQEAAKKSQMDLG